MYKFAIFLLSIALAASAHAAVVVADFESVGGYTTSIPEFTNGISDYFVRSDGSNIDSSNVYNSPGGSYFFAGNDIQTFQQPTLPLVQTFNAVNISGLTGLGFSIDLAEDDSSDMLEDYDNADSVLFEYSIDGGAFTTVGTVDNGGAGTNFAPLWNGTGAITDTFATFTAPIGGTGNSLVIRATWNINANDEDLAIDNLYITSVPEPGSITLVGLAALGFLFRRKR